MNHFLIPNYFLKEKLSTVVSRPQQKNANVFTTLCRQRSKCEQDCEEDCFKYKHFL